MHTVKSMSPIQSCSSSSEGSKMFLWRFLSTSVSPLSAHHKMMPMQKRLTGSTFHQGRSNWLPSERSTFHTLWLALLVENLMGSSFTVLSSVDLADGRELRVSNRILVTLFVDLALQKYILLVVFTRPVRARLADILRHCSYSGTQS